MKTTMTKQFPIEDFEYRPGSEPEAEAEPEPEAESFVQVVRDHRASAGRSGPRIVTVSPATPLPAGTIGRYRSGYAARRAPTWRRFPHLPFPQGYPPLYRSAYASPYPSPYPLPYPSPYPSPYSQGYTAAGGCTCDAPPAFDGGAPSSLGGEPAPASPGGEPTASRAGAAAGSADEIGPWDPSAPQLASLAVVAPGRHPFRYAFTQDDLLWTARFLTGEAGGRDNLDNAAVIWAMFNRFGLFAHGSYSRFHAFLRAYSTPLQPVLHSPGAARRHMADPQFVTTGEHYPGTDIPKGQLRRYLALQDRPWRQLPTAARALAARALRGDVANPIGNASEFASTAVYYQDRYGKRVPDEATWRAFTERHAANKHWTWIGDVAGLDQRSNAFFLDARAAGLPAGAVRVTRAPGATP